MKNEDAWNRWFNWLKPSIVDDFPSERIAWVKIIAIGLPIHLRFEENMNLVAEKVAKVIAIESSQNWHSIDLTTPHARILTAAKMLINVKVNCYFSRKRWGRRCR